MFRIPVVDIVSPERRSEMLRAIRSRDTKPEKTVRSWLHRNGYRFRVNRRDLPGTPDIVLPKYGLAIFVHGCYWHRHENCRLASVPKSNVEYWETKFEKNLERDRRKIGECRKAGWQIHIIWECETRKNGYEDRLGEIIGNG